MAITSQGIGTAVWHFCYEAGRPHRQLPWALWRSGDAGEEGNRYVVPLPPGPGIESDLPEAVAFPASIGRLSGRISTPEYMPFSPFPYDGARPSPTNSKLDRDVAGPIGIHFFGGL